jgi:hypothetical protein
MVRLLTCPRVLGAAEAGAETTIITRTYKAAAQTKFQDFNAGFIFSAPWF